MNPAFQPPEQPNTPATPVVTPDIDPTTFVPKETSVEADSIALDAISELEAEEDTVATVIAENEASVPAEAPQPAQANVAVSSMPVPSDASAPNVVPVANSSVSPQIEPAQTNSNPFPVQKNSPKKRILTLIAAVVLFGAGVAGFFVWQSMQNNNSNNTIQETTGNQPGGTTTSNSTDTETSVNNAADSLTTTTDSIDDTTYGDTMLSDTTLYGN